MSCFKIKHVKIHAPAWLQKSASNVSRSFSNLMNSLKNIKPSATPLNRKAYTYDSAMQTQPTLRKNVDSFATSLAVPVIPRAVLKNNNATPAPYIPRARLQNFTHAPVNETHYAPTLTTSLSAPVITSDLASRQPAQQSAEIAASSQETMTSSAEDLMELLKIYKTLAEETFFKSSQMPDKEMVCTLMESESHLFPGLLAAFNAKHGLNIKYTSNPSDNVELAVDGNWSGRQQFIYENSPHSVCVDLYKDKQGNISVITIDSLTGTGELCTEGVLAAQFNEKDIPAGKLSQLFLKTDTQKNFSGCKFFSMHFAKTAANDKIIQALHQENIKMTAEEAAAEKNTLKPGELREKKAHPHTFASVEETAKILNARYYKHSHSSTRLNALPQAKREEAIFKNANVIERSKKFRVQKTQILAEFNLETKKRELTEKVFNFSNSIEHFRRKRIIEAEAFLQARLDEKIA